jgi:hypothetical protein
VCGLGRVSSMIPFDYDIDRRSPASIGVSDVMHAKVFNTVRRY